MSVLIFDYSLIAFLIANILKFTGERGHTIVFDILNAQQDVDNLLEFDYIDDDITSLRLQMRLPVSMISTSSQGIATPGQF